MTRYFTEEGSVEAVNARMGQDINPRLAEVMASLVKHLHAFAKEIDLTQDEWEVAIDFLTRTGQICSEERQEFILLSDTLGFSMLVDAINNRRPSRRHGKHRVRPVPCGRGAGTRDGRQASRSTARARAVSTRAA